MAHEFESGIFVKEAAWHRLGTVLDDAPGIDDAYEKSGLTWSVNKKPLSFSEHTKQDDDSFVESFMTPYMALVRDTDRAVLGVCAGRYNIFQNKQAFDWCRPLVDSGLWAIEAAGSLCGGKTCWILLKHDESQIIPNDVMKRYLMVNWSHSGTRVNVLKPTSIRVVCQNTLTQALRDGENTKITHTSAMFDKYTELQSYWTQVTANFKKQEEAFKRMLDVKIDEDNASDIVEELFPNPRAQKVVMPMVMGAASGHKDLGVQETAYGVFMAISESVEHILGGKSVKDRGEYVLYGRGHEILEKSFNRLYDMVPQNTVVTV